MNNLTKLLILALIALPALGQEIQVPLDSEDSLQRIGRKLERELRLFPDHPGFREAQLFQLADTTFALEIHCRQQGIQLKYRTLLTADQVDALRQRVTTRIQNLQPRALLDRDGRTRFLMRTFLLSYGFYAWAIPAGLDLDGRAAATTALLAGSAGFFAPFAITNQIPVSQTTASFSAHLGTTGIAHGMLLGELLLGSGNTFRSNLALGTAGSLAGLIGGFKLGRQSSMSAGTAELIGSGGNYGLLMGLGSAHLAEILDEDHRRQYALAALTGSGLGYWSGHILAGLQPSTRGDTELLGTTAVLGAYLAATLVNLTDTENERAYTAAAMSGSAVGIGLGHSLLQDHDFSTGASRMIMLGSAAGYLLGGAVNQILGGDSPQSWLSLTSLGAAGGFWKTYQSYAGEARADSASDPAWSFNLAPPPDFFTRRGSASIPLPYATVSYRFL